MASLDNELDLLDPEEEKRRAQYQANPTIARPSANAATPPLTLRGVSPTPNPATSAPAPSPVNQDQTAAQTELGRLRSTGSGISQIKNPVGRGLLRGLETIGGIGEATGLVPRGLMGRIPGTEQHNEVLQNQQTRRIGQDVSQQQKEAQTTEAQARTEQAQSEAEKNRAATAAAGEPKPKEEEWVIVPGVLGPNGEPIEIERNSGQGRFVGGVSGAQPIKPPVEKPDTPEQQYIDEFLQKNPTATKADAIKAYARDTQKPERAGAEDQRGERSYQATLNRVEKLRAPVEQRLERISRLEDTLNQNSPQADALIAPELLTVMAGGQGSGLRMNEAEIARIIGGRTNWETLKARIHAWELDPNKPFALTPDQRAQTRALFTAIKDRVSKKAQAIDEESQNLADVNDPKEHRQIYQRLQKRLLEIDTGAGGGGTVKMQAPDGTTKDVPTDQVEHYKALGAKPL